MLTHTVERTNEEAMIRVATALIDALTERDSDRCYALLTEDATYCDNIGSQRQPIAGITRGRAAVASVISRISSLWTPLAYRPGPIRISAHVPNEIHCQIEFVMRHKSSGELLFGKSRLVARVEDDLIKSINIFHDAPMFEAFLRLIGSER